MFSNRLSRYAQVLTAFSVLLFVGNAYGVGALVQIEIYDRAEGRNLPVYQHDGRSYVAGQPGHEYAILLRGNGNGRVLAVMSVDGVNVVTGDSASPSQSGYVLSGYGSTEIDGWRKSLSRTAAFYFTSLDDSYAARTKRPWDVGVIGVALFRERVVEEEITPNPGGGNRDGPAAAAPPATSAESNKLGTGHGRSESSWARYTDFRRASNEPTEIVTIYYDSYRNLVARGIIPAAPRDWHNNPDPNPFPSRFVPDPS